MSRGRRAALRLALGLGLLGLAAGARAARVTFVLVDLPRETPAGAALYLASNAAGWDPARPEWAFARVPGGPPRLTLDLPAGTLLQFKVTRGSWDAVETLAGGTARDNRLLEVRGDREVELRVERWADAGPPGGPLSTQNGDVERLAGVFSPELGNRRDVLVWLPPGYRDGARRYPVVYMHDGGNVFDASTSFAGVEWRADETAAELARRGRPLIVVAVAASPDGQRLSEYGPWPVPALGAAGRGDAYADFVARTLKPLIDARFRTRPGRASTAVLGSSMGGLVSLYMALRDPEVFGFAGALSPSLWFADSRAFSWVDSRPPAREAPRVWLDMGAQEGDTQAQAQRNVALAREMARRLRRRGVETRFVVARGAHTETAWAERLPAVLEWWLTGLPTDDR